MPIYEYKCKNCGAHIEKIQKVSDAPLTVCENCGGEMEKQLSLSGFQFKGAGWYVSDYSSKFKDPNQASASKPAKTETSDKAEKTSVAESTAKTDGASNSSNDTAASSKKETSSKND